MSLSKIIGNKYFIFTALRYLSYLILFVRGFFIAKLLGPTYFGIWASLMLFLQYLSLTTLGVQYSLNNALATDFFESEKKKESLINSAFIIQISLAILLGAIFLILSISCKNLFNFDLFFDRDYLFILFLIIFLQNSQQIFNNVFRINGKITIIAITELLNSVVTLSAIFLFEGEDFIFAFFAFWLVSLVLTNLLFIYTKSFEFKFLIIKEELKELIFIGIPLLIYNFSFYLTMLASRTIAAIFYNFEILGYFSLANNITTGVLLGLDSLAWIFYPKLLENLKAEVSNEEALMLVNKINSIYSTLVFLVIMIVISISPLIYLFLPKYSPLENSLVVLLITQGVLSMNLGYVTACVARKKNYTVLFNSLLGAITTIATGLLFSSLKLSFFWLSISTLLGAVVFTTLCAKSSLKLLGSKKLDIRDIFAFRMMLPCLLVFSGFYLKNSAIINVICLLIFVFLNFKGINSIVDFAKKKLRESY